MRPFISGTDLTGMGALLVKYDFDSQLCFQFLTTILIFAFDLIFSYDFQFRFFQLRVFDSQPHFQFPTAFFRFSAAFAVFNYVFNFRLRFLDAFFIYYEALVFYPLSAAILV